MLYTILKHSHSGLRWILIILFLLALIGLFRVAFRKKTCFATTRRIALSTLIVSHLQLIIGMILYFISPLVIFSGESMTNKVYRFYLVEHISLMIIAIILITIGYSQAKKISDELRGFKRMFTYYLIAFILILVSIPWPFRGLGAGWF